MKKVSATVCCSRCGDMMAAEELALSPDGLCALCSNMHLEAREVIRSRRGIGKAKSLSLQPVSVKPQSPRPLS